MGIMLGLLVVGIVGFAFLVYFAAQDKKFFTAPREGTAEFVMEGNRVRRMIAVWKGHHQLGLDEAITKFANVVDPALRPNPIIEQYQIVPGEPTHGFLYCLNPLNWMQSLGIYWVGIWPFIKNYLYDFIWTEEKVTEDGKIVPHTRRAIKKGGTEDGQTPFVKINDTNYFFVANDVKTIDGVPLKFILLVTVRVENPYKALFSGADWLERTGGAINNMTMRCVGVRNYEQVTKNERATLEVIDKNDVKGESLTKTLEEFLVMLGDGSPDDVQGKDVDLLTAYGVRIIAAKIHSFDFSDEDAAKQYRTATTQKYVAEQEGLGEQAKATGQAAAIHTLADAEAYRVNTSYTPIAGDSKEARMKIRQLEALEKSGDKGGNTIVIPDDVLGLARRFTQK